MIIPLPEVPPSCSPEYGAIRARASAALSLGAAHEIHWLLGAGPGVISATAHPSGYDMTTRRIYHRPGANAQGVVVAALIEGAPEQGTPGTIKFTPSGGDYVADTFRDTPGGSAFSGAGWSLWIRSAYLTGVSYQYHEIEWADLGVRQLAIWEMPRGSLDTDDDVCILRRSGVYAGTESGRQITDSTVAGISAYLARVVTARKSLPRHFNWFVPDGLAWSDDPGTEYAALGDKALATTKAGFPHRARKLAAADTSQSYTAHVRAKWTDIGASTYARVKLVGDEGEALFTAITTSHAYHDADGGNPLAIGCAADAIIPYGVTSHADGSIIELTAVSFVEEV